MATTTYTYEYDDCGVLCRYNDRLGDWEVLEPHCLNCGYGEDDHRDDECDWEDAPYTKDDTPASQRKWYKGEEKKEEEPEPEAKPKPKKFFVRGTYHMDITWKIPEGIDLDDKETYEYHDRWGTLYIDNIKTGERVAMVEGGDICEDNNKFADDLEHLTDDEY
jgi:hypothetical protein